MELALRKVIPEASIRLWSGTQSPKGGGWIGFNINESQHYLILYLEEADVVVFETFHHKIDPGKFVQQPGEIFESYGDMRWMMELDLVSPEIDFYSKPFDEQMKILENFIVESLCIADELSA
jgi:hypothetical protein